MLLEMVAEAVGDRTAVGPKGGRTYAQLLDDARRVAVLLHRSGATNAAMVGSNSDAVPMLLFGAALGGVPFAPVNYRLPDEPAAQHRAPAVPRHRRRRRRRGARLGDVEGIDVLTTGPAGRRTVVDRRRSTRT